MHAKLSIQAQMNMADQVAIPVVEQMLPVSGDFSKLLAADSLGFVFKTPLR